MDRHDQALQSEEGGAVRQAGDHDATFGVEDRSAERIEAMLRNVVAVRGGPRTIRLAIERAVFAGGGRVRPALCCAVAQSLNGRPAPPPTLGAACAIELMHCASLVHDDLPCFDDATIRRGLPSVHAAFGEPLAVLTGDALIVAAYRALRMGCVSTPERLGALMTLLDDAVNESGGIIGGQAWESERDVDLLAYHDAKTGSLFRAAAMAGARSVDADPEPWRALGTAIGRAYQLADDLGDLAPGERTLGKPTGQDKRHRRPSAANDLGPTEALRRYRSAVAEAKASVPDVVNADRLVALIDAMAKRLLPRSLEGL